MNGLLQWLEAHPGLAGYAQFLGSFIALIVAIGMPLWQRRTMERAAELALRSVLTKCWWAVVSVKPLITEADWDMTPYFSEDGDKDFAKVVRDLDLAVTQLKRVSLFELKPRCATLVQELQTNMSTFAAHFREHVEGNHAAFLETHDLAQHESDICRLMLGIVQVAPASKDRFLVGMLKGELNALGEWSARERARLSGLIRRMNSDGTPTSAIALAWHSLRLRFLWLGRALR